MSFFVALFEGLLHLCVIFGPLVAFAAQYMEIRRVKNSEGFSTRVSLVLVVANITRVYFWYDFAHNSPG